MKPRSSPRSQPRFVTIEQASAVFVTAIVAMVAQAVFAPANVAAAAPTPIPHPSQTAPPDLAAPSPTPLPLLVSGQLIDLERGFVVFASGDAFAVSPAVAIVDNETSRPPGYAVQAGVFALIALDPSTSLVTSIRTALAPIPGGTPAAEVPHRYVAEASSPLPNPDIVPKHSTHVSKLSSTIQVDIVVEVPASTSYTDDVYMTTDTSGWNPRAIRMQRIDGRHFRISLELPFNTDFHYMFTRGSWTTVERDRAGLQRQPRELAAGGAEELLINATVFRWADDS